MGRRPFRDVTVGRLLTQLADALPDNEALVYLRLASLRWTSASSKRSAADRARTDRLGRRARRSRRRLGDQRARMDRPAVRAREDRRDPRHRQHFAARPRDRVPASPERGLNALHDRRLQGRGLHGGDSRSDAARRASACSSSAILSGRCDAVRAAAHARGRACPTPTLDEREAAVGVDDVINMQYTSGTTGISQGRHALEPQHRQQRLLDRRGPRLHAGRIDCACACRCSIASAACSACSRAYTHGACLCPLEFFEPRRVLETVDREKCTALYGVPTMFLAELEHPEFARFDTSSLRTGIMAGALVPGAADAARHRSDEDARADDRLRPDRDVAGTDADAARRRPRRAHADGRPRHARNRSAHRRSGDRCRCAAPAATASCGRAATW